MPVIEEPTTKVTIMHTAIVVIAKLNMIPVRVVVRVHLGANMNVGDLVYEIATGRYGIVERIDVDYYGSRTAFKHLGRPRGHCVDSTEADIIAPTRHGVRNRVLVCWPDGYPEYRAANELEIKSINALDNQ